MSKNFERDDILTGKDAISGLKSSPWEGLGKLVNTPCPVHFLLDDTTTFNIGFSIPYTLQKAQPAVIKKTGPLLTLLLALFIVG